jgi:integrase
LTRIIGKLTALKVDKARKSGLYSDGGGLYLRVTPKGTKNWVYRFMLHGRARWMGMGALHTITLAEARGQVAEHRKQRFDGIDPIAARRAERQQASLDAASAITFKDCAARYIAAHKAGWRSAKHAAQWEATLATYAEPIIGSLSVQAIDTGLVLRVLEPIWTAKPETASRLRGRIEAVLDWAKARGYRQGENPARWRGHLDYTLPATSKVRRVTHHAALPYEDIGDFVVGLREQEGTAARALEFAILTAARTGEVIGATWSEFDLDNKTWTVPSNRMKSGRDHRVPLSDVAMKIVEAMASARAETTPDGFVFEGGKHGRPLSNMSLLMLLRRMKRVDLTSHGFRSSFRDWAAERTGYPREVAEMALAHRIPDAVEAAYRRGDLFEKRRKLMDTWARACATSKAPSENNVAQFRAKA